MKKFANGFSCVLLCSLLLVACSKDNEQDYVDPGGNPGGGNCVTANMKYAANIKPILQTSCYSCHGNGLSNGGVILDTYEGVKAVADDGRLVGAITHAAGFSPMPQGGSKLSDCNINKIKSWVQSGAPNN